MARGVDPVEGATSYQAALVQADARRKATLSASAYGWWRGRSIFSEADTERPTEVAALLRVQYIDDAADDLVPFNEATIAELWHEVARELWNEDLDEMPLRMLHQHQRTWDEVRARRRARWIMSPGGVQMRALTV